MGASVKHGARWRGLARVCIRAQPPGEEPAFRRRDPRPTLGRMTTVTIASCRLPCPAPTTSEARARELFAAVRADTGALAESAAAVALVVATASAPVFMTLAILGSMLR